MASSDTPNRVAIAATTSSGENVSLMAASEVSGAVELGLTHEDAELGLLESTRDRTRSSVSSKSGR
jgi:hypothetical protein